MTVDADTFANPVHPGYFADPFVMAHGGRYFAYGTARPGTSTDRVFEVLVSEDLVRWESVGHALRPIDGLASGDHWAPEVAERDGRFYLYFSAGVEDRDHGIHVAAADRPEGPFELIGGSLTPHERFAIDAHPFRDDDGSWYLFYARDRLDGDRVGTSIVVDRLVEPDRVAAEPVPAVDATADWQLYQAQREIYGAVYDWHTVEGPFVVKRGGRYWCLYSGGAWTNATYGVGYRVADRPLGPFVEEDGPEGPTLLRTRPGGLEGPGHTSVVTAPDGADYVVYHAWDSARTARRMCIDRLDWTPTGPRTTGPNVTPQPVPRRRPTNDPSEKGSRR